MRKEREWIIEVYPAALGPDLDMTEGYQWGPISEIRWREKTGYLRRRLKKLHEAGKLDKYETMLPNTLTECVRSLNRGRARGANADYRFRNVKTGEIIPATVLGL